MSTHVRRIHRQLSDDPFLLSACMANLLSIPKSVFEAMLLHGNGSIRTRTRTYSDEVLTCANVHQHDAYEAHPRRTMYA